MWIWAKHACDRSMAEKENISEKLNAMPDNLWC